MKLIPRDKPSEKLPPSQVNSGTFSSTSNITKNGIINAKDSFTEGSRVIDMLPAGNDTSYMYTTQTHNPDRYEQIFLDKNIAQRNLNGVFSKVSPDSINIIRNNVNRLALIPKNQNGNTIKPIVLGASSPEYKNLMALSDKTRATQAQNTAALQKAYPQIDFRQILQHEANDPKFLNTNIEQKADSLRNLYGDVNVPSSPEHIRNVREYMNLTNAKRKVSFDPTGAKEKVPGKVGFEKSSWRDIITRFPRTQENPAYEYLREPSQIAGLKKGGWISKAVNPAHKGYCTPMTKSTCTPRRKAFAMTMKKHHGFHKKEDGGIMETTGGKGPRKTYVE